jgi:beta-glucosidase/6-phospho-beta-glucosidase/beta-galactosidase
LRWLAAGGAAVAGPRLWSDRASPKLIAAIPKVRWDPAQGEWESARGPDASSLFENIFLGGFECSTHYRRDGTRLDIIAATKHDLFAAEDYGRLKEMGITTCRDAARWHLIEQTANWYTFDSLVPMAQAAQSAEMQVIWDLMHYGWPDHVDIYSSAFPSQFASFAQATVQVLDEYTDPTRPLIVTPINEISFLSWAGGDNAYLNPYARGRGAELKRQLVRAACEAMAAMKDVCPRVRFLHCDPIINVVSRRFSQREMAEAYRLAQYEAFDMIRGDIEPDLGGEPEFLDIIGVNYYRNNQTFYDGTFIDGDHEQYKPLADMLIEVWQRYRRPLVIAETGVEDDERAQWLRYIAGEAGQAMLSGVALHGITWYPILNHPGWEDDRHCRNGLWDYADDLGGRLIHTPLAQELQQQMPALMALRANTLRMTALG